MQLEANRMSLKSGIVKGAHNILKAFLLDGHLLKFAIGLLAVVALIGCGGPSDSSSDPNPATNKTDTGTTSTPTAPSTINIVASNPTSSGELTITWAAVAGATFYQLYRNGTRVADNIAELNYIDRGLAPATNYSYTLTACNTAGCSIQSDPVTMITKPAPPVITPPQTVVPAVPVITRVGNATHNSLTIYWSAAINATYYQLYSDGDLVADNIAEPYYIDKGLGPLTDYSYTLTACNAAGCSTPSEPVNEVTLKTPPPPVITPPTPPPTVVPEVPVITRVGNVTHNSLTVYWSAVANATYYQLYSDGYLIADNIAELYYIDKGLGPLTDYSYTLTACNAAGCSPQSDPVNGVTLRTPPPPLPPTAVPAVPDVSNARFFRYSPSELEFQWEKVAGANSYQIFRDNQEIGTIFSLEGFYVDIHLDANTSYNYNIAACNTNGCSPRSATISNTTLGLPPTRGDITIGVNVSGNVKGFDDIRVWKISLPQRGKLTIRSADARGSGSLFHPSGELITAQYLSGFMLCYVLDAGDYIFIVSDSYPNYNISTEFDPDFPADYCGVEGFNEWTIDDYGIDDLHEDGITGEGVTIAIVDTGTEIDHEDLRDNFLPGLSYNYVTKSDDPTSVRKDPHGTASAGVAAARSGNDIGITGVAGRASLLAYNLLEMGFTFVEQADAMTRNANITQVHSNSYGSGNTGAFHENDGLWTRAIDQVLLDPSNDADVSYVWAGGNGRQAQDDSNYGVYTNHYGVIAVCAVGRDRIIAPYSEPGANLWLCGPSGSHPHLPRITTTDLSGTNGYNSGNFISNYADISYTNTYGGTSASAPFVAGVIALMRQANPNINWRDVKLILAQTSDRPEAGNIITGAEVYNASISPSKQNYEFHYDYGFGIVNATRAVAAAQQWSPIDKPFIRTDDFSQQGINQEITNTSIGPLVSNITVTGSGIDFIEFVDIRLTPDHNSTGDLEITLISPSGRESRLANSRTCSGGCGELNGRRFGSAIHLGESADGEWSLRVIDKLNDAETGNLNAWRLRFYGHEDASRRPLAPQPPPVTTVVPAIPTITGERFIHPDSLQITWDAVVNATFYQLYRNGKRIAERIDDLSYTDSGITPSNIYSYNLVACNNIGCSEMSAQHVHRSIARPPATPDVSNAIFFRPSPSELELQWGKVDGALNYQIFRDDKNTGHTLGKAAHYTDRRLDANTTYSYNIAACNMAGCSDKSATISNRTLGLPPTRGDITIGVNVSGDVTSFNDLHVWKISLPERGKLTIRTSNMQSSGALFHTTGELIAAQYVLGFMICYVLDAGDYIFVASNSYPNYNISTEFDPDFPSDYCGILGFNEWTIDDYGIDDLHQSGTTGEGVTIAIVDTGAEIDHEDLRDNFLPGLSYNYITRSNDPTPIRKDPHGTASAGVAAARSGNDIGVTGVAGRASLLAYNLIDRFLSENEADAMTRNANITQVNSNSWGAFDTGTFHSSDGLWVRAIDQVLLDPSSDADVSYVWAAGNGRGVQDNSNYGLYTNYYGVIAVCAVGQDRLFAPYSEPGANLWLCGPSASHPHLPRITTTDLSGTDGYNRGNTISNYADISYTNTYSGTSAATPFVAGVIALMRQANPNINWRDVKLILAQTSDRPKAGGIITGAEVYNASISPAKQNYEFHYDYGFGIVNATRAVVAAQQWSPIDKPFLRRDFDLQGINQEITNTSISPLVSNITVTGSGVDFIEFVEIGVTSDHNSAGDLEITLISPSGRESRLTNARTCSDGCGVLNDYRFGSALHLGESADGEWSLRVIDKLNDHATGNLNNWRLRFFGH